MLPKFRPEQTLNQMSAAALNELVQVAELIRGLSVQAPLTLDKSSGGLSIGLAANFRTLLRNEQSIVITREPVDGDEFLEVRGVRYRDNPPRQGVPDCDDELEPVCRYEWTGDPFEASPDFGARLDDYTPYVWLDPRPRLEAFYLRARYDAGVWIVELPAQPVRHVVIRAIPGDAANYVDVQNVRPHKVAGVWDNTWEAYGPIWSVGVYAYSFAGDYRGFLWPAEWPVDVPEVPVQTVYRESGGWWLQQYIRYEVPLLDEDLIFNDCVKVLRRG